MVVQVLENAGRALKEEEIVAALRQDFGMVPEDLDQVLKANPVADSRFRHLPEGKIGLVKPAPA
jgi:hypothetical protein